MKFTTVAAISTFAVSSLIMSPLSADLSAKRDTASLLFENPDWSKAPAGTKLKYDYTRDPFGSADYGPKVAADTIALTLEPGANDQSRKVDVQMFSGERRRSAGPFESVSTNPVLLLVFEEHVQELAKIFKANPRYLKNAIRKAWRDAAKIEDVDLSVGNQAIKGTRVTIQPFVNDDMKDRMKGLEGLTYVVDISDTIPGEIVDIDIHAPLDGSLKFKESLHYEAEKTP